MGIDDSLRLPGGARGVLQEGDVARGDSAPRKRHARVRRPQRDSVRQRLPFERLGKAGARVDGRRFTVPQNVLCPSQEALGRVGGGHEQRNGDQPSIHRGDETGDVVGISGLGHHDTGSRRQISEGVVPDPADLLPQPPIGPDFRPCQPGHAKRDGLRTPVHPLGDHVGDAPIRRRAGPIPLALSIKRPEFGCPIRHEHHPLTPPNLAMRAHHARWRPVLKASYYLQTMCNTFSGVEVLGDFPRSAVTWSPARLTFILAADTEAKTTCSVNFRLTSRPDRSRLLHANHMQELPIWFRWPPLVTSGSSGDRYICRM